MPSTGNDGELCSILSSFVPVNLPTQQQQVCSVQPIVKIRDNSPPFLFFQMATRKMRPTILPHIAQPLHAMEAPSISIPRREASRPP